MLAVSCVLGHFWDILRCRVSLTAPAGSSLLRLTLFSLVSLLPTLSLYSFLSFASSASPREALLRYELTAVSAHVREQWTAREKGHVLLSAL